MSGIDPVLSAVVATVAAWRNGAGTEVSAARHMFELACLLGIEPPPPVAGRVIQRVASRPAPAAATTQPAATQPLRRPISPSAYTAPETDEAAQ